MRPDSLSRFGDAVEMIYRAKEQGVIRDGGSGPGLFVDYVPGKYLEVRATGQNMCRAVSIQAIDLDITGPR
jgi:hypothetical protein